MDRLIQWAAAGGIELPDEALARLQQYGHTITEANKVINLTRITEPTEIEIKHFIDSLEILRRQRHPAGPVIDLGSGAGLPGIPLKIACPHLSVTLLDSSRKRVAFLRETIVALGLENIKALHARAEDAGRDKACREQYGLAVSRAVARLNVLAELCLPFVKPGGSFIAYKGPDGEQEADEANGAITRLGGLLREVYHYSLPEGMGERTLIIIEKVRPTPVIYPRKAGIPEKKPLRAYI